MQNITYTIKDEIGLHARPAGQLVKLAAKFPGKVQVGTPEKMVDCKRVMGVMGLAMKQGDTIHMTFDGDGEEQMAKDVLQFLSENL